MKSQVQCIGCRHFDLRSAGQMAAQGYGNCAFERPSTFQSATFPRHCQLFVAVDQEDEQRRRQWLADKQEKFNESLRGHDGSEHND